MTRQPDPLFDQRIADWLDGDAIPGIGNTLESILAAFPTIPQRRARLMSRTPLGANRLAYLAAGMAAVVVAAAGGFLLNSSPPSGGPRPPSATSVASSLAPSASPTHRLARNGLIAVVKDGALALVDPITGMTVKVLIQKQADENAPIVATDPTWAPDGRRLAFGATGGVWVMNVADGSSQQILSCGIDADACAIAWSPDGSRIAVVRSGVLDLVDPDGGNRTTLLSRPWLWHPTWSPDGRQIAVVGSPMAGGDRGLYVVDRDGSHATLVINPLPGIGVWDPAWSPDGSTFAYIGSTDLRVCQGPASGDCHTEWQLHVRARDVNGSESRELHGAGTCYCLGFAPGLTWSPDATSLALVTLGGTGIPSGPDTGNDGDARLLVIAADGTGLRHVADQAWGSPAWQPLP